VDAEPDFVEHVGGVDQGREDAKQFLAAMIAAMPDMWASIEDMIAAGDKVVVRFTMTGTQHGEFMGIPATGKAMRITAMSILRVVHGKIAEHWAEADWLGMMQQLGAIPAPGYTPG
jgi:steroid delta-isomerase-like uncharacterized protein